MAAAKWQEANITKKCKNEQPKEIRNRQPKKCKSERKVQKWYLKKARTVRHGKRTQTQTLESGYFPVG